MVLFIGHCVDISVDFIDFMCFKFPISVDHAIELDFKSNSNQLIFYLRQFRLSE